jgi:hypothetical protein
MTRSSEPAETAAVGVLANQDTFAIDHAVDRPNQQSGAGQPVQC